MRLPARLRRRAPILPGAGPPAPAGPRGWAARWARPPRAAGTGPTGRTTASVVPFEGSRRAGPTRRGLRARLAERPGASPGLRVRRALLGELRAQDLPVELPDRRLRDLGDELEALRQPPFGEVRREVLAK